MAATSISLGLHKVSGLAISSHSPNAARPAKRSSVELSLKTRGGALTSSFVGNGSVLRSAFEAGTFDPLCGFSRRASGRVSAVAAPALAPAEAEDPLSTAEGRALLAKEYGFRQIGEPVPEGVTLKKVIDSMPKEVFELNNWKAWKTVVITLASYAAGILMIAKAPWYLLPFAWAWTGTAATGFFVIGHDCAHKAFTKNKLLEDIVGTFPKPLKVLMEWGMGPLRPWASIGHWYLWHFDLKKYRQSEQNRVKISLAAVFAFMAIGWPTIIYYTGIAGWFKFWLMPWLGYHFWMSTFTMVHHTAPHIPFKGSDEWNSAAAQLGGTVHCDYPSWIEVLCHDINVHIPHHISQKIPSYNLRLATDSLRQNWGKHLNEASWNWRLMKTIMTTCHVYDEERNYVPIDEGVEESPVIGSVRKLMPEYN
jgi:omega-6 fatty acid desaturase (delta-12 desaturase)